MISIPLDSSCRDWIKLADGGALLFVPNFLPRDVATKYLDQLLAFVPWQQLPGVFGHLQPRLTAAYGDSGVTYRYSGTTNHAMPWTQTLLEIKAAVEVVAGEYNFCLLNRYRSGSDRVGWHADDEPGLGNIIGSLSLGATRTFRIRHNVTKEMRSFEASHGTLIVMAGLMQKFWKHEVPKMTGCCDERVNLTFRRISALPDN